MGRSHASRYALRQCATWRDVPTCHVAQKQMFVAKFVAEAKVRGHVVACRRNRRNKVAVLGRAAAGRPHRVVLLQARAHFVAWSQDVTRLHAKMSKAANVNAACIDTAQGIKPRTSAAVQTTTTTTAATTTTTTYDDAVAHNGNSL